MTRARAALTVFALMGCTTMIALAQSVSVARIANAITVRAPGLGVVKGRPLERLKDGRAVRVDFELDVMPGPGGATAAQARQTYLLSYDLWEERFAVTLAGTPPRAIAYLTAAAAEAWCLEQLAIPISTLGRLGRELPFWIRLGYRVLDADPAPVSNGAEFSLRGMIEALSPRKRTDPLTHSIEAGPFRLPQ